MIKGIFTAVYIFILCSVQLIAQVPEVPSVIYFADMTLRLDERAKREIQTDVNTMYRSPTYFQVKLDRVNLYMPVVEQVLREQGAPDDLKYLVIQESSLISDAVSTSNAVGFWQFKKGTAEEVFLRVDQQIDERKCINSSTRGAALYLKKHHRHLDNWATALVSYQMGLGGANNYFNGDLKGKRTMDINKNTHWYFKKYLAHKIAFEGVTGSFVSNDEYLHEYPVQGPTTLAAISKKLGVSESHLKEFNKWTSNGQVPGDRTYVVSYIRKGIAPDRPVLTNNPPPAPDGSIRPRAQNALGFPKVTGNLNQANQPGEIKVNRVKAILAKHSASQEDLARQAEISEWKLRRSNDLKKSDAIQAGRYYYTKIKKSKAAVDEHIVQPGETLWEISQLYGLRLHSLKAKNRIYKDEDLIPGMVLKLRKYYKKNEIMAMARPVQVPVNQKSYAPPQKKERPKPEPVQDILPEKNPQPSTPTVKETNALEHQVQPGDTLYAISRKYGVSIDELKTWNQIGGDNHLSVGQKLSVRKNQ